MTDAAPMEGGELFTRGGLDMPDTRGATLVAKHAERQQKEKEERAMSKLHQLLPHLGKATHAVALQECNWEEDRALAMLRMFAVSKAEDLRQLQKERKKQLKWLEEKTTRPQTRDDSGSSSGSESDRSSTDDGSSGSESADSSDDDRSKRKSSHKRSRSSKSDRKSSKKKKHRKEKDSKRRKDKKRKKEKKEKRDSKRRRSDDKDKAKPKEPEYGAFGVIRETDYYTKRPEFTLWALEIKKADVEAMSRYEEKELFKSFMEDYNTATLPHRKYYNLESYEREERMKGSDRGGTAGGERMVFDDEAERKKEVVAERQRDHAERLRAAYEELQTTDKAQAMREQELMRAKMALAYRTGDLKEAARLAERLKPDEPK